MSEQTSKSEKPRVRQPQKSRLHLTPDEAHGLISTAGRRGRYPCRDRLLLQIIYRHGLRASKPANCAGMT